MPVVGISGPGGFVLAGGFDPDDATEAVWEALRRLQAGQRHLAVTDDCGTSLLANGVLASVAVIALTRRRSLANFPLAVTATMLISRVTPRLGRWLQRSLTTDAGLETTEITRISVRRYFGRVTVLRASTVPSGDIFTS